MEDALVNRYRAIIEAGRKLWIRITFVQSPVRSSGYIKNLF